MNTKNSSAKYLGAGLLSALAASLCCIAPLLALLAGSTGLAAASSWMEPARPWLIAFTVAALALAWYQKLKPLPVDECGCAPGKLPFLRTKTFLAIVTALAALILALPCFLSNCSAG